MTASGQSSMEASDLVVKIPIFSDASNVLLVAQDPGVNSLVSCNWWVGSFSSASHFLEKLVEERTAVGTSAEDATLMSLGGDNSLVKKMTRNWSQKKYIRTGSEEVSARYYQILYKVINTRMKPETKGTYPEARSLISLSVALIRSKWGPTGHHPVFIYLLKTSGAPAGVPPGEPMMQTVLQRCAQQRHLVNQQCKQHSEALQ